MESSSSPSSSPECPVCLQCYDGSDTVPRVLPCGHSACESCLGQLRQRFPQTIRCPACTQLVKFPSPRGPSSLPKNIDLLRLCGDNNPTDRRKPPRGEGDESDDDRPLRQFFLPDSWSDEFYTKWRKWILPQEAVSVEGGKDHSFPTNSSGKVGSATSGSLTIPHSFQESCSVSLVPAFSLSPVSDSAFRFSYLFRVMNCLSKMEEDAINEMSLILRMGNRHFKVSEVYGLWGNVVDGMCYLVCHRRGGKFPEILNDFPDGFVGVDDGDATVQDGVSSFAMIGLDMCEAVVGIYKEKLVLGCLGISCVDVDTFGHASIHLNDVLEMGREACTSVASFVSGRKTIRGGDFATIFFKLVQSGKFVSPEVLLSLLKKNQVTIEGSLHGISSVSYGSDVWSVGCVLIRLLIGKQFTEENWNLSDEEDLDFAAIYEKWLQGVSSLLEIKLCSEFRTLCQMLCGCLNLDQGCRPVLAVVWKSMRELLTKHWFDILKREEVTYENSFPYCLILGKLCQVSDEVMITSGKNNTPEINGGLEGQEGKENLEKDFGERLSLENVKCKELRSHLDCVTGLAIGGGFLFSSSFDRTLQLWSLQLQDFSHVHTFHGHEQKIMDLVYVDEEQPLCVTVDSGGGIFVWDISSSPLGKEPLKKWHEEKDWRYSGIHSVAYSRSGYLYTGGGDKLIKVWILQDCSLSCIMEGHKSVVSSLVVSEGALYSGSWDGTVRLWSLSDHSPLTVLGEDIPGTVSSVLSVKAEKDLVFAVHENGTIKVWKNDELIKSAQSQKGAIFAVALDGKWLMTGGWDKIINIQELSDEEEGCRLDFRPVGSIPCGSVITTLLSYQGKLFVGSADRTVKVYYSGTR